MKRPNSLGEGTGCRPMDPAGVDAGALLGRGAIRRAKPASMRGAGWMAACCLSLALAIGCADIATAQTLDLGGVPSGPSIGAKSGARDLSDALAAESTALLAEAQKLAGEARTGLEAKARMRAAASYLLAAGAENPWSESACAVAGFRIAGALRRADEAIDAAVAARRLRPDAPLSQQDAQRAIDALRMLAAAPLSGLRTAAAARADAQGPAVAAAAAELLAPLATVASIVEGSRLESSWPVLSDARSEQPQRVDRAPQASEARAAIAAIAEATRPALESLLGAIEQAEASPSAGDDLGSLVELSAGAAWIDGRIAAGAPWVVPEEALRAALDSIVRDADALAGAIRAKSPEAAAEARSRIAVRAVRLKAAEPLIAWRSDAAAGEQARDRLADAATALVVGADSASARQWRRAAERILACCEAATVLRGDASSTVPRDFREVARQLEREGKIALRSLPGAFAVLAGDPAALSDPSVSAPLDRVTDLAKVRDQLSTMQTWIEKVAALRPAAKTGFTAQLRRLARLQLDPIRRAEAQAALDSLVLQFSQTVPFPFEEELKRGTERAMALTGGRAEALVVAASTARVAWADALARGDFGGVAAQRLDAVARLLACLRDLDGIGAPISRAEGDRLAAWGGWAARRSVLAPATQDLDARALLAVRSLLADPKREAGDAFGRDVAALEKAIPLVRLASRLERTLTPGLRGSPDGLAPMLAPIVDIPGEGAFLGNEWTRLAALSRAMFEAEYARRSGNAALVAEFDAYLAALARDLERVGFGARPAVAPLPGFDGTQPPDGDDRRRSREPPVRSTP